MLAVCTLAMFVRRINSKVPGIVCLEIYYIKRRLHSEFQPGNLGAGAIAASSKFS